MPDENDTLTLEEEQWDTAWEDVVSDDDIGRAIDADEVNDEAYDDDVDDDDTPAILPAPVRDHDDAAAADQPGLRSKNVSPLGSTK